MREIREKVSDQMLDHVMPTLIDDFMGGLGVKAWSQMNNIKLSLRQVVANVREDVRYQKKR